jgi:excisionase family DNA binding protein
MCAQKKERCSLALHLQSLRSLLTSREVANFFGVHQETVYRWTTAGFPHTRVNGRLRFDPIALAEFLERRSA